MLGPLSFLSGLMVGALSGVATAATFDLIPANDEHPAIIFIEGNFELGDERRFVESALGLQEAVVVFNSDGGNLFSGLRIGEAIHQWGFSTAVLERGTCASVCALAWLGGQRRFLAPTARVGFHAAYQVENGSPRERGAPNARIGAYLGALGLSPNAIEFLTSSPPESISWINIETAARLGILVEQLADETGTADDVAGLEVPPPNEPKRELAPDGDTLVRVTEGTSLIDLLKDVGIPEEAAQSIQTALVVNFSFDFRAGQQIRIRFPSKAETKNPQPVRVGIFEMGSPLAVVVLSGSGTYVAEGTDGAEPSIAGVGRAMYYFQGVEGSPGHASDGSAAWAMTTKEGQPAVQATIKIPERSVTVTVTFHKNDNTALPASHLVEVQFDAALSSSPIQRIPSLVLKQTEQARGQPLAGAAVPVTNELFWIALSSEPEDVDRNMQLLKEGSWFDIPILFNDQTRALITFEKGALGERLFSMLADKWTETTNDDQETRIGSPPPDYRTLPNGTIVKIR